MSRTRSSAVTTYDLRCVCKSWESVGQTLLAGDRSRQHLGPISRRSGVASGSGRAPAISEGARHRPAGGQGLPSSLQGATPTASRHPRRSDADRARRAAEPSSRRHRRGRRDRSAARRTLVAPSSSAGTGIVGKDTGCSGREGADRPRHPRRAGTDTPVRRGTLHRGLRRPLAEWPPRLLLAAVR